MSTQSERQIRFDSEIVAPPEPSRSTSAKVGNWHADVAKLRSSADVSTDLIYAPIAKMNRVHSSERMYATPPSLQIFE